MLENRALLNLLPFPREIAVLSPVSPDNRANIPKLLSVDRQA
jgi:hypothetical protein